MTSLSTGGSATATIPLPPDTRPQMLGHPVGLFLLFMVEMWERFSYYGMRALLVLYLTSPLTGMRKLPEGKPPGFNPGPGWSDASANTLYGWYTGLAYLTPVIGGIIADKLIGTHRSMLVGGFLIMCGHILLSISGMFDHAAAVPGSAPPISTTIFMFGLAVIVLGTGHFKPSVSVMVGQLYDKRDPRRDGAFSIFYMGINLGAFLCAFVCGTLGELKGWHWGFGAAAVGMSLGLAAYVIGKRRFLAGIGELARTEQRTICLSCEYSLDGLPGTKCPECGTDNPPLPQVWTPRRPTLVAIGLGLIGLALSAIFAAMYHAGALSVVDKIMTPFVTIGLGIAIFGAAIYFVMSQRREDRGPTASIFIFMMFNAFFWLAFEQAGSSITLFTDRYTDLSVSLPGAFVKAWDASGIATIVMLAIVGVAVQAVAWNAMFVQNRAKRYPRAVAWMLVGFVGFAALSVAALKLLGWWPSATGFSVIPTSWFQAVNPLIIITFAPAFAAIWTQLGKRNIPAPQPVKIAAGLILLGLGFVVLVIGALTIRVGTPEDPAAVVRKAALFYIVAAYFLHTMGELCLSPTGLSYVTKAAPVRFVSLLMGIWFISSFIANLGGGLIAAQTEKLERGESKLWWSIGGASGSVQADFFLLFVFTSIGAGVIILLLTPLLRKLMRHRND